MVRGGLRECSSAPCAARCGVSQATTNAGMDAGGELQRLPGAADTRPPLLWEETRGQWMATGGKKLTYVGGGGASEGLRRGRRDAQPQNRLGG